MAWFPPPPPQEKDKHTLCLWLVCVPAKMGGKAGGGGEGGRIEEKQEKKAPAKSPDISFIPTSSKAGKNNNERILELHSQGKSNVAIAKELGLGIGEVKLVIDLFEGM